jgi:hypothetical protein
VGLVGPGIAFRRKGWIKSKKYDLNIHRPLGSIAGITHEIASLVSSSLCPRGPTKQEIGFRRTSSPRCGISLLGGFLSRVLSQEVLYMGLEVARRRPKQKIETLSDSVKDFVSCEA